MDRDSVAMPETQCFASRAKVERQKGENYPMYYENAPFEKRYAKN